MPEPEDEKQEDQKPARPVIRFEKRTDIEKGIELNMPNYSGYPDIKAQLDPESLAEYMRKLKDL